MTDNSNNLILLQGNNYNDFILNTVYKEEKETKKFIFPRISQFNIINFEFIAFLALNNFINTINLVLNNLLNVIGTLKFFKNIATKKESSYLKNVKSKMHYIEII